MLRILTLQLENVGECQRVEQLEIKDQHFWSELDHGGQATWRWELLRYPMNHIGIMNHSLLGCGGIIGQIMTAIKAGQVSKKLLNVPLAIMTYLWAINRDLLGKILL